MAITWQNSRNPRRVSEHLVSGREIRNENTKIILFTTIQWSYFPRSSQLTAGIAMLDAMIHHEWTWQEKAVTSAEISPAYSGYCTKLKLSFRETYLTKLLSVGL
jgi:hypothetical protein